MLGPFRLGEGPPPRPPCPLRFGWRSLLALCSPPAGLWPSRSGPRRPSAPSQVPGLSGRLGDGFGVAWMRVSLGCLWPDLRSPSPTSLFVGHFVGQQSITTHKFGAWEEIRTPDLRVTSAKKDRK
jgi:hypothetical protein